MTGDLPHTDEETDELLEYYTDQLTTDHLYFNKPAQIKNDFHLITIQRKLKDTGRFQFIKTVKGNDSFIKSVPQSLEYVKQALDNNEEYGELKKLLEKYLPEFQ